MYPGLKTVCCELGRDKSLEPGGGGDTREECVGSMEPGLGELGELFETSSCGKSSAGYQDLGGLSMVTHPTCRDSLD